MNEKITFPALKVLRVLVKLMEQRGLLKETIVYRDSEGYTRFFPPNSFPFADYYAASNYDLRSLFLDSDVNESIISYLRNNIHGLDIAYSLSRMCTHARKLLERENNETD